MATLLEVHMVDPSLYTLYVW